MTRVAGTIGLYTWTGWRLRAAVMVGHWWPPNAINACVTSWPAPGGGVGSLGPRLLPARPGGLNPEMIRRTTMATYRDADRNRAIMAGVTSLA